MKNAIRSRIREANRKMVKYDFLGYSTEQLAVIYAGLLEDVDVSYYDKIEINASDMKLKLHQLKNRK